MRIHLECGSFQFVESEFEWDTVAELKDKVMKLYQAKEEIIRIEKKLRGIEDVSAKMSKELDKVYGGVK